MKPLTLSSLCKTSPWLLAISSALISSAISADDLQSPLLLEVRKPLSSPLDSHLEISPSALEMLRAASNDTASLLRHLPGLSLNGAGAVSSLPSIRGLADDRLRIQVEGMDLIAACPNHMNPPLSYIEPSHLGELKVYAGISPVSLGGDSIGGTILAKRKKPEFALPGDESLTQGEVGAFYRSNHHAVGGNLGASYATDLLSLQYSGAWSQANNYKAGGNFKDFTQTGRPGHSLSRKEVGSTAYETQNHALDLAYKLGVSLLEAQLSYQEMPEQLFPNQRMDLLGNTQKLVNLAWSRPFDWGQMTARVYHERVDHFMDFGADKRFWYGSLSNMPSPGSPCAPLSFHGDPNGTCAAGMPMYSESDHTGLSLQADIQIHPQHLLRVGSDLRRYRLEDYWTASGGAMGPGTFLNIHQGQRDRSAFFAEVETQHSSRWNSLLGVRYEQVRMDAAPVTGYNATNMPGNQLAESQAFNAQSREQTDHNWDFALLTTYAFSPQLDIELGLARKVRSPNLYERYTWSSWPMAATMNNFVGDGNGYLGDIQLQPETAYTASASFDWHAPDRKWQLRATPFYTHVDDYIDAIRLPGWAENQFNVLQLSNQSARLYGVDLSMQLPLADNAWGQWGLNGLINYTQGKNRDSGDRLYHLMPLNGRFTLTHQRGAWDNALEWVLVDRKNKISEVRNEVATSGYSLLNLRTSHNWQQVRVDFGIENLFDRNYALPTGGAYLGQGSTMSINGLPWGIAVPGMGRSVYLGMNLRF